MPHGPRSHRHGRSPVQSVTTAPASLRDEQAGRIRRYLLTMGIRTACFVLAVVTATAGAPWWIWGTLAVLALVLPYIAVVLANAVSPREGGRVRPVTPPDETPKQIDR